MKLHYRTEGRKIRKIITMVSPLYFKGRLMRPHDIRCIYLPLKLIAPNFIIKYICTSFRFEKWQDERIKMYQEERSHHQKVRKIQQKRSPRNGAGMNGINFTITRIIIIENQEERRRGGGGKTWRSSSSPSSHIMIPWASGFRDLFSWILFKDFLLSSLFYYRLSLSPAVWLLLILAKIESLGNRKVIIVMTMIIKSHMRVLNFPSRTGVLSSISLESN